MAKQTILCFGDSNTHGTRAMNGWDDRRRLARDERWPGVMAAALGDGWSVIEEGHPGRTTVFDDPVEGVHKNGLAALPVLLETHRPLDLVILMLGTNDLKARFAVTAADVALGLERLAMEILRSDAGPSGMAPQVLIASPVPVEEAGFLAPIFAGAAEKARALPEEVEAAAARLGTGYLNLAEVATVDPEDGIHLGKPAHEAIGQAMAKAVRERFS